MSSMAASESLAAKIKRDARLFIEGLAERMAEFNDMADRSSQHPSFQGETYADFKCLFVEFMVRTEEFLILSLLTEDTLVLLERHAIGDVEERRELDESFRKLQLMVLERFVSTQLRLLKVWDDRYQQGAGLPYGSSELFGKAVSIIHAVKDQLLRPRYVSLLDENTIEGAETAERMVRLLVKRAPRFHDFTDSSKADMASAAAPEAPFSPGIASYRGFERSV